MLRARFIDVTYTHTEGMETCIVAAGIPFAPDTTLLAKRRSLENGGALAHLKTALLNEPKGHVAMYGGFLVPPSSREFDTGIIWSDGNLCNDMCGHGTIALGMAMVSGGLVAESADGHTFIRFETTLGNQRAVVPTVKGTANIIGYAKWLIDPKDPVGQGFVVT